MKLKIYLGKKKKNTRRSSTKYNCECRLVVAECWRSSACTSSQSSGVYRARASCEDRWTSAISFPRWDCRQIAGTATCVVNANFHFLLFGFYWVSSHADVLHSHSFCSCYFSLSQPFRNFKLPIVTRYMWTPGDDLSRRQSEWIKFKYNELCLLSSARDGAWDVVLVLRILSLLASEWFHRTTVALQEHGFGRKHQYWQRWCSHHRHHDFFSTSFRFQLFLR